MKIEMATGIILGIILVWILFLMGAIGAGIFIAGRAVGVW